MVWCFDHGFTENGLMHPTLALVSRPDVSADDFTDLLSQLLPHLSHVDPGTVWRAVSQNRQVAKVQLPGESTGQLRADVLNLVEGLDLPAADKLCVAVVPAELAAAERLLLIMDVDSTLIRQEVIELLAAHAGREAEVAAVTEAAMRGELDFAQSLIQRVATLKGLPEQVLAEVIERIEFSAGAEALVRRMHAAGHVVAVVSGGFQQILDPLATELGLDHALANTLGITDGILDGTVHGDIVDRATKERMLRNWAAEHQIPLGATIAAGDGANDLDMVCAAGLGVAFNAKPALREQASVAIDFGELDVIADLVLQDLAELKSNN